MPGPYVSSKIYYKQLRCRRASNNMHVLATALVLLLLYRCLVGGSAARGRRGRTSQRATDPPGSIVRECDGPIHRTLGKYSGPIAGYRHDDVRVTRAVDLMASAAAALPFVNLQAFIILEASRGQGTAPRAWILISLLAYNTDGSPMTHIEGEPGEDCPKLNLARSISCLLHAAACTVADGFDGGGPEIIIDWEPDRTSKKVVVNTRYRSGYPLTIDKHVVAAFLGGPRTGRRVGKSNNIDSKLGSHSRSGDIVLVDLMSNYRISLRPGLCAKANVTISGEYGECTDEVYNMCVMDECSEYWITTRSGDRYIIDRRDIRSLHLRRYNKYTMHNNRCSGAQ